MTCVYSCIFLIYVCFVIQGSLGQTGQPGLPGPPGRQGNRGNRGLAGPPGERGERGSPGERGPSGSRGPSGNQGLTGSNGRTGPTGPTGSPGRDGNDGRQGSPGMRGESGHHGQPGPPGAAGRTGPTGVGRPGPPGPVGLRGSPGLRGSNGAVGAPGRCPSGCRYESSSERYEYYRFSDETIPKLDENQLNAQKPRPGAIPQKVVFQSFLSDNITGILPVDSPVPFQLVDVNIGEAYNASTGVFTAPRSGLYMFTFSLMVADSCAETEQLAASLYVKDQVKTELSSRRGSMASRTVHVPLQTGYRVWVQIDSGSTCLDLITSKKFNDFSGRMFDKI